MSYQDDRDEEREEAEDRIARIRGGGSRKPSPEVPSRGESYYDPIEEEPVESDAVRRARSRGETLRGGSRAGSRAEEKQASRPRQQQPAASDRPNPIVIVGGVIGAGLVIVLALVLVSLLANPEAGGGLFSRATPTPMPTPTATEVPATPTPTITPTIPVPDLNLPPLTCIFQSGTGCFDYCQNPDNASECQSAEQFISAQGADPDVFFECLSPSSGPNVGSPQACLEEAWIANNQ